jgi:hypothetical protein
MIVLLEEKGIHVTRDIKMKNWKTVPQAQDSIKHKLFLSVRLH